MKKLRDIVAKQENVHFKKGDVVFRHPEASTPQTFRHMHSDIDINKPVKLEYGEVVKHNAKHAHIKWDSGHESVHSQTTGFRKGKYTTKINSPEHAWVANKAKLWPKKDNTPVPASRESHAAFHEKQWKNKSNTGSLYRDGGNLDHG